MNNLAQKPNNQDLLFVVSKKHVNKKKVLTAHTLFDKIEHAVNQSITPYRNLLSSNPKSVEFNHVKNAFLDDELLIKNTIKKLSEEELELSITVFKKKSDHQDIVCRALISYHFKKAS